jgi:putative FmdB family regulatory protein
MPIYEYICKDCGYDFERLQSFSDDPLETCPECEGSVRRVISAAGVIFKGSGWYITDSRRQLSGKINGKGDKKKDTAGGEGGETKASDSGDSGSGTGESKSGESKSSESQSSESKSSGSQSTGSQSTGSQSSRAQPGEAKSGESKSGGS